MHAIAQAQFDPLIGSILIAAGAVTFALLWFGGVFRERSLVRVPRRHGRLSLVDIVIAFGLLLLGTSVAAIVAQKMGEPDGPPTVVGVAVGHIGWLPLMAYILVRVRMSMRHGCRAFGFGMRRTGVTLLVIVLGVPAMFALTLGVSQVLLLVTLAMGDSPPQIAHPTLEALANGINGPVELALVLGAVVAAPLFEEAMFRGLVQTSLIQSKAVRSRWMAVFVASLIFVLPHIGAVMIFNKDGQFVYFAWQALATVFVLSLCLGWVYERTGSLWPSIVMHMAFNAMNIAVVVFGPPVAS